MNGKFTPGTQRSAANRRDPKGGKQGEETEGGPAEAKVKEAGKAAMVDRWHGCREESRSEGLVPVRPSMPSKC